MASGGFDSWIFWMHARDRRNACCLTGQCAGEAVAARVEGWACDQDISLCFFDRLGDGSLRVFFMLRPPRIAGDDGRDALATFAEGLLQADGGTECSRLARERCIGDFFAAEPAEELVDVVDDAHQLTS